MCRGICFSYLNNNSNASMINDEIYVEELKYYICKSCKEYLFCEEDIIFTITKSRCFMILSLRRLWIFKDESIKGTFLCPNCGTSISVPVWMLINECSNEEKKLLNRYDFDSTKFIIIDSRNVDDIVVVL